MHDLVDHETLSIACHVGLSRFVHPFKLPWSLTPSSSWKWDGQGLPPMRDFIFQWSQALKL